MTWAAARTALKDLIDGATADAGAGFQTETMRAYEFPPSGEISAAMMPCAWIWPPARLVTHPPMMRHTEIAGLQVEVALGGPDNLEAHAKRLDAWFEALATLSDGALALGGAASVLTEWEFSGLRPSAVYEGIWGFDISIGLQLYEAKANAA